MARRLQTFLSVLLIGFASFARLRERNDVRSSAIDARRTRTASPRASSKVAPTVMLVSSSTS
jgi:hypothetical protein